MQVKCHSSNYVCYITLKETRQFLKLSKKDRVKQNPIIFAPLKLTLTLIVYGS